MSDRQQPGKDGTLASPSAAGVKTILAVDDNQDDLVLLEYTLSLSGVTHRLLTAGDGAEAEALLDRIGTAKDAVFPCLIFLDVHMPGLDGLRLLARFKRNPRCAAVPVVMVSSFDDPGDRDRAFELGAAACLHKPPAPQEVRQLVNTLTDIIFQKENRSQP